MIQFSRHFNNCYWTEENFTTQIILKFTFIINSSENSGHSIHEFLYPNAIPERNIPHTSEETQPLAGRNFLTP